VPGAQAVKPAISAADAARILNAPQARASAPTPLPVPVPATLGLKVLNLGKPRK
jgi:hypothetical protein